MRRRKPKTYALAPTPEQLAHRFFGEALAAIAGHDEYSGAYEALHDYFSALAPHAAPDDPEDYWAMARLPAAPQPLPSLTNPYALYRSFCCWLRKQGIDPETVLGGGQNQHGRNQKP